jgi:sugar phosphate isomerase/epimerase
VCAPNGRLECAYTCEGSARTLSKARVPGPGSGPFDFVHYATAMHKAGYTGFIGMEVELMVQRK